MNKPLEVPVSVAARKGPRFLSESAENNTVLLTNHGNPTAVVMNPRNFEEFQRTLKQSANTLIEGVADLVAEETTFYSVDEARKRLREKG